MLRVQCLCRLDLHGQKCDDLITDFEVKGRSIISTCIDRMTCWARLTHDCLRWDFGEEWLRSEEPALPKLSSDAIAKEALRWSKLSPFSSLSRRLHVR